jgi:hypothetical protein
MDTNTPIATPNPTEPVAPAAETGSTTDLAPTRKVAAGGLAGALTIILIWILNNTLFKGQVIPPELASATNTIFSVLVAYFVPES